MMEEREGMIAPHQLQVNRQAKLGQGGYGVVYRGKYEGLEVAVKELLLHDLGDRAKREFKKESEVMFKLRDPRVVHLYGVTIEQPYQMVMEYCTLGSLDDYLQKREKSDVSWNVRFHLATGIASGLAYLHSRKPPIIHGDLKSMNVLLTGDEKKPEVKLADFGLSLVKTETKSKTKTSGDRVALSLSWAAPEILSLGRKTLASDMYAYGMTLWEMASHEYPYKGFDADTISSAVRAAGKRPELPEETDPFFGTMITGCWEQEPEKRLSAESVLNELANRPQAPIDFGFFHSDTQSLGYSLNQPTPTRSQPIVNLSNQPAPGFSPASAKTSTQTSSSHTRSSESRSNTEQKWLLSREDKVKTAFFEAAKSGNQTKLLAYIELLDEGLGTRDPAGNTVLHHAVMGGHLHLMKWLVEEQKQDASLQNAAGDTALLLAAGSGQTEVVGWLIESAEMDSSERNREGLTALLVASEVGHLPVVSWLLMNRRSWTTEKTLQQKTVFTSPNPSVVLWCTLYREISKSKEGEKSPALESILAYEGSNAKQLQVETAKLLIHCDAQKLMHAYRDTLKGWWFTWSEAERSMLPTLPKLWEKAEKLEKPVVGVVPHVFQQPEKHPEPKPLTYPEQVEQMSCATKTKKQINEAQVKALLKWVTEGHLVEVEKLLKDQPSMGVCTGTVTDLSDRTFKGITVLQYAAWSLDIEMCELIITYIGAHNASIQFKALSNQPEYYSTHGARYDMTPLITKAQTYVDNCEKWWKENREECTRYWQKEVGGEQRKCPAWLIYAWSEAGADVSWTKKDASRKVTREYDKHRLVWWFTKNYNDGAGVGSSWSAARGSVGTVVMEFLFEAFTIGPDLHQALTITVSHDCSHLEGVRKYRHDAIQRVETLTDKPLSGQATPRQGFCAQQ